MPSLDQLSDAARAIADAVGAELISIWFYYQIGLLLLAALMAFAVSAWLKRRVDLITLTMGWPAFFRLAIRALLANAGMIVFVIIVVTLRAVMLAYTQPAYSYLLSVAASLASAWVIIHLLASLIHNRFVVNLVAITAWTIAALSILGALDRTVEMLDALAVQVGSFRLSLLLVTKVTILLLIALWVASTISGFVENRVQHSKDLTPSIRVLIAKVVRLSLIAVAVLVVLGSTGIDLTALAWFSGALGVGVGLGLQKVVANIVSGIVLLADKSIKPGDVISVGESFGFVRDMGTRYISVVTRDGREILIPNEDLVTRPVVNWSYTKAEIRLDVKFSVDPANDPHKVRAAALAAVKAVPRVLDKIPPACHLVNLEARSMDFLLRFWIDDPIDGVTNVRGLVLLALWDVFQGAGIKFPSPIQDMRLRGTTQITLERPQDDKAAEPRVEAPRTMPD
jgi:small-conductance mechanosensitive channel